MAIVKKVMFNNRSVVASLLAGWLLLCGMMPLLMVDMSNGMNMGLDDSVASHSQHHHSYHHHSNQPGALSLEVTEEKTAGGADQHCCDVLEDGVLSAQSHIMLFSLVAVVCSFVFFWVFATRRINTYYYSSPPFPEVPLRKRLCVWLD